MQAGWIHMQSGVNRHLWRTPNRWTGCRLTLANCGAERHTATRRTSGVSDGGISGRPVTLEVLKHTEPMWESTMAASSWVWCRRARNPDTGRARRTTLHTPQCTQHAPHTQARNALAKRRPLCTQLKMESKVAKTTHFLESRTNSKSSWLGGCRHWNTERATDRSAVLVVNCTSNCDRQRSKTNKNTRPHTYRNRWVCLPHTHCMQSSQRPASQGIRPGNRKPWPQ